MLESSCKKVENLSKWRKSQELTRQEDTISSYLEVLSFNELLMELKWIKDELNNSLCQQSIYHKSLLILRELSNRICNSSAGMSDKVDDIRSDIESRLSNIKIS